VAPRKASRPAPALAGCEPRGTDLGQIDSVATSNNLARQRLLDLFAVRCRVLAERINSGSISFIDAVDMAYSAAIWSGLADDLGDDAVQAVMRDAFMGTRR
jgi:hypothetical protein